MYICIINVNLQPGDASSLSEITGIHIIIFLKCKKVFNINTYSYIIFHGTIMPYVHFRTITLTAYSLASEVLLIMGNFRASLVDHRPLLNSLECGSERIHILPRALVSG